VASPGWSLWPRRVATRSVTVSRGEGPKRCSAAKLYFLVAQGASLASRRPWRESHVQSRVVIYGADLAKQPESLACHCPSIVLCGKGWAPTSGQWGIYPCQYVVDADVGYTANLPDVFQIAAELGQQPL
jgi:hypothetical protein